MKVYGVTENELRTLTIINAAVAALFSLGAACLGYGLNIHDSLLLVDNIPDKAKVLPDVVQPVAFSLAGVFFLFGLIAWLMRGGFISTIKKETVSPDD
jgi:hypothetical protein